MSDILDILKYILPSLVVLGTSYLLIKMFLISEHKKQLVEIKRTNNETAVPIRLQAYERMALFLERISVNNLLMKVEHTSLNAAQFQSALLKIIRHEFEYNLSQQIYMSNESWELIKKAKEDTIRLINLSTSKLNDDASAFELSKIIINESLLDKKSSSKQALEFLKKEISEIF